MANQTKNFITGNSLRGLQASINRIDIALAQISKFMTEQTATSSNAISSNNNRAQTFSSSGIASQPPVNIIMNISTPDAGSFRMSQGQLLSEATAAIMRASRRNV